MITVQKKVLGLDVAMYDAAFMCMAQTRTDLFEMIESFFERRFLPPHVRLQIAAGHVFEDKVMEDHSLQIAGSPVSEAANDVRMPDAIEGECFVLKILYKGPLEIGVKIILQKYIERLYNDGAVW